MREDRVLGHIVLKQEKVAQTNFVGRHAFVFSTARVLLMEGFKLPLRILGKLPYEGGYGGHFCDVIGLVQRVKGIIAAVQAWR